MKSSGNARLRARRALAMFASCSFAIGCQSYPWPFGLSVQEPTSPEVAASDTPSPEPPSQKSVEVSDESATASTEPAASPLPIPGLSDDRWVMNVRPLVPGVGDPKERWHHPALDATLALRASRPDLTPALANPNPVVAANAAVIVARWRAGEPVAELTAAARNVNLRMPLRLAAIESLGSIAAEEAKSAVEDLLNDPLAAENGEPRLIDVPDIHAELLYARAKHVSVLADDHFTTQLKNASPVVRCEAASAWARNRPPALAATPDDLLDLCSDNNTKVRVAAIRAVAVNRHPRAAETLGRATGDYDLNVRVAAIAALGELGTDEARRVLDKVRKDPSEIARAAAVSALAAVGVDQALLVAATDKSPRVRQAVADSLKQLQQDVREINSETKALAHQLIRDASSEVQRRAVESLRTWPLEQAGPALLLAMDEGAYSTRKLAAEQLAGRWPAAKTYYADGTDERRAEQLNALRNQWEAEFGKLDELVVRAAATEVIRAAGLSPAQLQLLDDLIAKLSDPDLSSDVRQQTLEALQKLGPDLVTALEAWTLEDLSKLPPEIYSVVLPEVSPLFAALERLSSADSRARSAAITELAAQLDGKRLSDLVLKRLVEIVEAETDPIVWQTVLTMIANDVRPVAVRLAYVAVANSSSEVRRRACVYLQSHADKAHLELLSTMLEDPNVTVAIAAARAIGAAGVGDPEPLIRMLNSPDKQLRLEAALALARSRVEAGFAAIERLSHETDLEIRRAATVAMGEIGNAVFLPALVKLLDDRRDIQLAAMASLTKIAGRDMSDSGDPGILPDEKVRRWKKWCSEQVSPQP